MKTALVLLATLTVAAFAADQPPQKPSAKDPSATETPTDQVKKLGSVTWDLQNHKLVWVVKKGSVVNGKFVPASEDRYEISPDEATMANAANATDKRGFSDNEAASLQHLLDVLSLYCAESVVWWDQGEGTPLGPNAAPGKRQAPGKGNKPTDLEPGQKPVRVADPAQKRPRIHVSDSELIAALTGAR